MLGPGADSLSPSALRGLANRVSDSAFDLAVPHYSLPPNAGLVNSAIMYPLTRALFGRGRGFRCRLTWPSRRVWRSGSQPLRSACQSEPVGRDYLAGERSGGGSGLSIDEIDVGSRICRNQPNQISMRFLRW